MRSMLCLALLVPAMVLAGILQPVTTVAPENGAQNGAPAGSVVRVTPGPSAKICTKGAVDTIGGTIYDWQFNGPGYRYLVNSPDYGLHAGFMASASPDPYPDRNMRYNFFNYDEGRWAWNDDPDFMVRGMAVYVDRSGFGNLDADPVSGVAVFCAHNKSPIRPEAARDMAPGAGVFEYANGSPQCEAYQWPPISINQDQKIQCALVDNATQDQLWYASCGPWPTWSTPVDVVSPQPQPLFPDHNIAASKVSQKVCVTWEYSEGTPYEPAFYRTSEDGGATWGNPTELELPPAYGQDTTPTFHITSLFPWYDRNDRLHIVANICPIVRDTTWILPAEIWHWCPDNTPAWSKIHRHTTDNLMASVGYNAILACRPSIGESDDGRLFVAWEQFDSMNVEPVTNLVRAEIFVSGSNDGGATWVPGIQITDEGTQSFRFPSVPDRMALRDGVLYCPVLYMIDEQAGFLIQGQGSATNNPVVVQWIPADSIVVGLAEGPSVAPRRLELAVTPNPVSGRALVSYGVPRAGNVSLVLHDASGRPVQTLASGYRTAGRYQATLSGDRLSAGVYFYTLTTDGASVTKKLTLVR